MTRDKVMQKFKELSSTEDERDFMDQLFRRKMQKVVIKQILIDRGKTVRLKREIPNLRIFRLKEERNMGVGVVGGRNIHETTLHTISRPNVPLVLNFGSCS